MSPITSRSQKSYDPFTLIGWVRKKIAVICHRIDFVNHFVKLIKSMVKIACEIGLEIGLY